MDVPRKTIIAAAILAACNSNDGYRGFEISIEYYYGEDNHGGIGWTPGPVSVRGYT